MSQRPKWLKQKHESDPYKFEESDARSLSRGSTGRTPGSGRLFPGQLDSEVEDFKSDNKSTAAGSYRIHRDFWLERIAKSKSSGHNFRESILFHWDGCEGPQQFHVVVVEGGVFEEIYWKYLDFCALLNDEISIDELKERYSIKDKNRVKWDVS